MGYRIGFPGWQIFARAGCTLSLRVDIAWDNQTQRFTATSPDLPGLIIEAGDWDELRKEVDICVRELVGDLLQSAQGKQQQAVLPTYRDVHACLA